MAFDFPASPTVGQAYTLNGVSYVYNGYAWMQSAAPTPQGVQYPAHGGVRLIRLDDNNLRLSPYNGNRIVIGGESRQLTAPIDIPKSKFTSAWGYLYAFWTGTAIDVEYSTTARITGNDGIEIKTGDPSRTLLGMAYLFQGLYFRDDGANRLMLNWFNRRPKLIYFYQSVATASAALVPLGVASNFLCWAGEEIEFSGDGYCSANGLDFYFSTPMVDDILGGGQHGDRCDAAGHYGSVGGLLTFAQGADTTLHTLRAGMRTTGAATATAQFQLQGMVWG